MDLHERKQQILEILAKEGRVKVNELSALFDISEVTIRMDLADLEAKGMLSRVHGGAVSSYKTYYNMSYLITKAHLQLQRGDSMNFRAILLENDINRILGNNGNKVCEVTYDINDKRLFICKTTS